MSLPFDIEDPTSNPRFVWTPIESGPWSVVSDSTDQTGKRTVQVSNGTDLYVLTAKKVTGE